MDRNAWYDAILKIVEDEDLIVTWYYTLDDMYNRGCSVEEAADRVRDEEANW